MEPHDHPLGIMPLRWFHFTVEYAGTALVRWGAPVIAAALDLSGFSSAMTVRQLTAQARSKLVESRDFLDALSKIVQIIAIILGGVWSYNLFIKERVSEPRAALEHSIQTFDLGDNKTLLSLRLKITNVGKRTLPVDTYIIRLFRVTPLYCPTQDNCITGKVQSNFTSTRIISETIPWPMLKEIKGSLKERARHIEPGEQDYLLFDFIINSREEVVRIYSFFEKIPSQGGAGWEYATYHNLKPSTDNVPSSHEEAPP